MHLVGSMSIQRRVHHALILGITKAEKTSFTREAFLNLAELALETGLLTRTSWWFQLI